MDILQFIEVNTQVLTFLTSLFMLVITVIYVYFTAKQTSISVNALQESVKQFKEAKQPCIIPYIKKVSGCAFDTTKYLRIQLGFDFQLTNVGDSPAISIYSIALMRMRHSSGEKEVCAHLMPKYIHSLSIQETKDNQLHFETAEFRDIMEDLEISYVKNMKRIETDPRVSPFRGPSFQLIILYKNLSGQWYRTSFEQDLLDIKRKAEKNTDSDEHAREVDTEDISNRDITDGDRLVGRMINPAYSHLNQEKISSKDVEELINKYSDEDIFQYISGKK